MARRKSPTFTVVELEFMQIIWKLGEVTTEDIQNTLKDVGRFLSDGSIRKILSILMTKGHLVRRRDGRSFYYKAKVEEDKAQGNMVQDLLKRAFGGSVSLMVAALFDGRDINKADIDDIKKLISDHELEENA